MLICDLIGLLLASVLAHIYRLQMHRENDTQTKGQHAKMQMQTRTQTQIKSRRVMTPLYVQNRMCTLLRIGTWPTSAGTELRNSKQIPMHPDCQRFRAGPLRLQSANLGFAGVLSEIGGSSRSHRHGKAARRTCYHTDLLAAGLQQLHPHPMPLAYECMMFHEEALVCVDGVYARRNTAIAAYEAYIFACAAESLKSC
eukprot:IDg13767t1